MSKLVTLLILATTACSFVAVRPTPQTDPKSGIERCEGGWFVLTDFLGTIAFSVGGVYYNAVARALNDRCGVSGYSQSGCSPSVAPFIPALLLGASTIYGLTSLNACGKRLQRSPKAGDQVNADDRSAPVGYTLRAR